MELTAWSLGAVYALWVFFLAVMNLKQASDRGTLGRAALVLGLPVIVTGYVLDMTINATLATLLFLELPREKTLSERLQRWSRTNGGFRARVAVYTLGLLLDPFDASGGHRPGV